MTGKEIIHFLSTNFVRTERLNWKEIRANQKNLVGVKFERKKCNNNYLDFF